MDNAQVEVTQEDREAAADWFEGPCTDTMLASAFARHRIAAEERGFQAAKEAAGEIVADYEPNTRINALDCALDYLCTAISNMEPVK